MRALLALVLVLFVDEHRPVRSIIIVSDYENLSANYFHSFADDVEEENDDAGSRLRSSTIEGPARVSNFWLPVADFDVDVASRLRVKIFRSTFHNN